MILVKTQKFNINPYDLCVANKVINGYQVTVLHHVDDLQISHKYTWEVTKMAVWLPKIYCDIKAKCGKKLCCDEF